MKKFVQSIIGFCALDEIFAGIKIFLLKKQCEKNDDCE